MRDSVSSQAAHAANIIDLSSYREQRKARQRAQARWPASLPLAQPYVAMPFMIGYWPWMMTPVLLFAAARPAEARHD